MSSHTKLYIMPNFIDEMRLDPWFNHKTMLNYTHLNNSKCRINAQTKEALKGRSRYFVMRTMLSQSQYINQHYMF